jgi:anti-sigma regulatory factor (Ser/Thr protein kinase)
VNRTELELPRAVLSSRLGRDHAASFLCREHREDLVPDATLIVAELVTNAVLHGGAPIRLAVDLDALLHIHVFDGDRRTDRVVMRPVAEGGVGGQGLHIVNRLADRWGMVGHAHGKTVWAELTRPLPALDLRYTPVEQ